jgi:hypothetical protein
MKKWNKMLNAEELDVMSLKTAGYSGADLRALCTEASLEAVKRLWPSIYENSTKVDIQVDQIKVNMDDFASAFHKVVPTSKRVIASCSYPLPKHIQPLLEAELENCKQIQRLLFPLGALSKSMLSNQEKNSTSQFGSISPHKARFILAANGNSGQDFIAHALLYELEEFPIYSLDFVALLKDMYAKSLEEAACSILQQALSNAPSIIFVPKIDQWWDNASSQLQHVLTNFLEGSDSSLIYFICTASCLPQELPEELSSLFDETLSKSYVLKDNYGISNQLKKDFFMQCIKICYAKMKNESQTNALSSTVAIENGNASSLKENDFSQEIHKEAPIPQEIVEKSLLRMRLRLRSLCMKFINDFKVRFVL